MALACTLLLRSCESTSGTIIRIYGGQASVVVYLLLLLLKLPLAVHPRSGTADVQSNTVVVQFCVLFAGNPQVIRVALGGTSP